MSGLGALGSAHVDLVTNLSAGQPNGWNAAGLGRAVVMRDLGVCGLGHHGDEDVPVDRCHAADMSAHADGYAPGTVDERAKFPMSGQCLSPSTQPEPEMAGRCSLEACPRCWMGGGACDC